MPRSILLQLGFYFAIALVAQPVVILFALLRSATPEEQLAAIAVPLIVLNLTALVLTVALVSTRRWRAAWRAFQQDGHEQLARLGTEAALLEPVRYVNAVPEEPANVYLEQPFQPLLRWNTGEQAFKWLDRVDAEQLIAVCALRLLVGLNLKGAYIGRTFHDTERISSVFDATPVRALRTQRRGVMPVYTFRVDRGRMHLIATFAVRRDGNIVTLGWHHAVLRATGFDMLRYSCWWSGLSFVGATFIPLLLPLTLLYAIVVYPPGRGWTSMWAKVTRDRLKGRFGTGGESWGERMEGEAFQQNIEKVFRDLTAIKYKP